MHYNRYLRIEGLKEALKSTSELFVAEVEVQTVITCKDFENFFKFEVPT